MKVAGRAIAAESSEVKHRPEMANTTIVSARHDLAAELDAYHLVIDCGKVRPVRNTDVVTGSDKRVGPCTDNF